MQDLLEALDGLLNYDNWGCPMCRNGKLISPEKEHFDNCVWNNARLIYEKYKALPAPTVEGQVAAEIGEQRLSLIKYTAGQYADSCMPSATWDRSDGFMVGNFYKHYIEKLLELISQPPSPVEAQPSEQKDGWVSVEDSPLFTLDGNGNWECTDNGDGEFLAAVPYVSKNYPGKDLWWIKHCVIEDGIGMCVVGDDDNEPAGWDMKDVTHYKILDLTPPQK